MRIAQLANFIGPASGGMKTAVQALGAGYADAGVERLLVLPGPTDATEETEYGRVVQLRAPKVGGGYRVILEPWRVINVLDGFGPTSLEVNDKSTLLPVTRWARRNGVGAILLSHERLDHMVSLRTGLDMSAKVSVALLNRLLVSQFDAVVVTSDFAREEFRVPAAAAGTPVVTVPLGVDLETFHPGLSAGQVNATLRLVHVGRLSREKSPDLAVATAVELHRRGERILLDVYGDGPQRGELEALARDTPVRFHGHVKDRAELAQCLAAADIALSVCPGETFGLAVLEALASGTPVVTASTGGASELIDVASGAWGEPDPASLADAVQSLARRLAPARHAARTRAKQFPWQASVDAMLAVHADVSTDSTTESELSS